MNDPETVERNGEGTGRARSRRAWKIWTLIIIVLTLAIAVFAWVCPPLDVRLVRLTCIHCGNKRVVYMARHWWMLTEVRFADIIDYPIEPGHEHRWFQWDSERQTSWENRSWSRDDFETGDIFWQGDVPEEELTRDPSELVREEWLR